MKANELQIGDWVQNPHGWKARVMSIKHTCVFKDEWEYLFKIGISKDTFQNNLSESDLSPIPLTPEILEKNGFNNVIWQGEASWSYHENEVYVCISGRSGGIKHFGYNGWDSKIAISSVHELQHALKLCGIEKEIEL